MGPSRINPRSAPDFTAPNQRRRLPRLACDLPVHCLSMDDGAFFRGRVVDISLGGVRLQVHRALAEGQVIKLKPGARMPGLRGRVKWATHDSAGLQFVGSPSRIGKSWVLDGLCQARGKRERRRHIRVGAELSAQCGVLGGVLRDLSLGGCCLATKRPLAARDDLRIDIDPPGELAPLSVSGRVLKCERREALWRHQVEFGELSREQTTLLGLYLVELIKASRAA